MARDELRDLEAHKRNLERMLAVTDNEQTVEVHPNMVALSRQKVTKLQSPPADETIRPQAMDLIRFMIESIEMYAGQEDGKPEIVLVGALAEKFTFTQQSKTAVSNGNGSRGLMVAGAHNCFYLLFCARGIPIVQLR